MPLQILHPQGIYDHHLFNSMTNSQGCHPLRQFLHIFCIFQKGNVHHPILTFIHSYYSKTTPLPFTFRFYLTLIFHNLMLSKVRSAVYILLWMATQYLVHLSLLYSLVLISNVCKLGALSSNHFCVCDFVFIYNCALTGLYWFEFALTFLLMVLNVHLIKPNTIQVSGYSYRDSLPNVTYQSLSYGFTIMLIPTLYSFTILWCYSFYCAFLFLFLSYCTLKSLLETSHYNTVIVWPDFNKTCYFEILKSNESVSSEYHLLNTNNNSQHQTYYNLVVNLSNQTLNDDQTKLWPTGNINYTIEERPSIVYYSYTLAKCLSCGRRLAAPFHMVLDMIGPIKCGRVILHERVPELHTEAVHYLGY